MTKEEREEQEIRERGGAGEIGSKLRRTCTHLQVMRV